MLNCKKNFLRIGYFTLVFMACAFFGSGQITISENDLPQPGTTYINTTAGIDLTIDPSQTGPGFTWDFQDLVPMISGTDTFTDASGLPVIYQLFFFGANLADKTGLNINFGQFTIEDVYNVYKSSGSSFEQYGYAGTLTGVPLPIVYNSKDVIYRLPLNYNNTDSSESDFEFSLPGLAYLSQQRKRVNEVDGWGTVITPTGTFDALRIKSTLTDEDSLFITSLGYGTTLNLITYEYKWLATDGGMPVLQINAQDVAGLPVVTQVLYLDTTMHTGIVDVIADDHFFIYPNPAVDHVVINSWQMAFPATLTASDATGRILLTENITAPNKTLDISAWCNGLYFLRIEDAGGIMHISKLIVQR
jgi:hypothetical protein